MIKSQTTSKHKKISETHELQTRFYSLCTCKIRKNNKKNRNAIKPLQKIQLNSSNLDFEQFMKQQKLIACHENKTILLIPTKEIK